MKIFEKIDSRNSLSLYNNVYNTNINENLYYPPLYEGCVHVALLRNVLMYSSSWSINKDKTIN